MIRQIILAISLVVVGAAGMAIVSPAPTAKACDGMILTFKPWHCNLSAEGPGNSTASQRAYVGTIALNIVDSILQMAGYVAAGFVISGGFTLMTSNGDPSRAAAGRKTITNALIGMIIAIFSVTLVNLFGAALF